MHALPFIAGSIHLITTVTTTAAQTCYYPNGEEAFKDTPCQTTQPGQTSACCASSAICLDNKLCLPQVGYEEVIWRGSCTDRSWQSGDCPQFCQDGKFMSMISLESNSILVSSLLCVLSSWYYDLYNTDPLPSLSCHELWRTDFSIPIGNGVLLWARKLLVRQMSTQHTRKRGALPRNCRKSNLQPDVRFHFTQ